MNTLLKPLLWLLYSLILLGVLAAGALAFVVFAVDPNWLKPEIEKQLSEQGFNLTIENDIRWQFFPNFGLQVSDVILRDEKGEQSLLSVGRADFSVAVKPLLHRDIRVVGLGLNEVSASLVIQKDGTSNWDFLSKDTPSKSDSNTKEDDAAARDVTLSIAKINVENSTVVVQDLRDGSEIRISDFNLVVENVSLSGGDSHLTLNSFVKIQEFPKVYVDLSSDINTDFNTHVFSLSNTNLEVKDEAVSLASLSFDTKLYMEESRISGNLDFQAKNLRALLHTLKVETPEVVPGTALGTASFGSKLEVEFKDDVTVKAESLSLIVDKTSLDGKANVVMKKAESLPNVSITLRSKEIDVNHFYTPKEQSIENSPKDSVEATSPVDLPVELLRDLAASVDIKIDKLLYKTLALEDVQVKLSADDGDIQLNPFSMSVNNGAVSGVSNLNVSKNEPTLNAKLNTENLNVGVLLKELADVDVLKGSLDSKLNVKSHGANTAALRNNLNANFNAQSTELRLVPIDLLKNVCETVAFLEKKPLVKQDWKSYTDLAPVNINASANGNSVKLDKLNAKVEKFDALAKGRFDLSTLSFDFPIELSLSDFAAELEGCNFISDEWRKKSFLLRCKGDVASIDARTCQPNYSLIREKWKSKVDEKVEAEKERAKERVEESVKDKIKDKLGDNVNEEDIQKLKDILKRR